MALLADSHHIYARNLLTELFQKISVIRVVKLTLFFRNWSFYCQPHYEPLLNSKMSSEPCALCQNWLTVIANKSLIPGQGQRQHTAAWRPARANPVARQQFTGKGGELLPGSSMAAQTPASSSRQDWVCNLPSLELLIRFRPGINVLLCWSNLNTPVTVCFFFRNTVHYRGKYFTIVLLA